MKALVDFVVIVILSVLAMFFASVVFKTIKLVYYSEQSLSWNYTLELSGSLILVVFCSIMFFIFGALTTVVIERLKEHFKR